MKAKTVALLVLCFVSLGVGFSAWCVARKAFWNREHLSFGQFVLVPRNDFSERRMIRHKGDGRIVIPSTVFILNIENGKVAGLRKEIYSDDDSRGFTIIDGKKLQHVKFPSDVFFVLEVESGKLSWFSDINFSQPIDVPVAFE